MKKTDKKREKAIREALTDACEIALDEVTGFQWLTDRVDYSNFPDSLIIICVFGTNLELSNAVTDHRTTYLCEVIKEQLAARDIHLRQPQKQVTFDTEEACEQSHGGDWQHRLRHHSLK